MDKWLLYLKNENTNAYNKIVNLNDEEILINIPMNIHPNLVDKYFSDILKINNINHKYIIRKSIDLILNYYTNCINFLLCYIKLTNDEDILIDYYNQILNSINNYEFATLIKNAVPNFPKFTQFFYEKYPYIYNLTKTIDKKDLFSFYLDIIGPIILSNNESILNKAFYIMNKNNMNLNNIEFIYREYTNYIFKIDNFRLKLNTHRNKFNIIDHYRINKSIIRKEIVINEYNKRYIELDPIGSFENISGKDICDALEDLYRDGIIITDANHYYNFAIVDYEIPDYFIRDVDGINEFRNNNNVSESYKNKKVKIVNKDYIYDKNEEFKYLPKIMVKRKRF